MRAAASRPLKGPSAILLILLLNKKKIKDERGKAGRRTGRTGAGSGGRKRLGPPPLVMAGGGPAPSISGFSVFIFLSPQKENLDGENILQRKFKFEISSPARSVRPFRSRSSRKFDCFI